MSNSISKDLGDVIQSGMCIACGACTLADESVKLELNERRQIFEPTSKGSMMAASVCPSVEVDYDELCHFVFGQTAQGPLGIANSFHLAQSTNYERNFRASSGGIIKETIGHLLQSGLVDGVISIDHTEGLEYSARLLTDPEMIDELPGSIYHNIDLSSVLEMLTHTNMRLGIVAIPCQLEGIYKYIQKIRPDLRSRIVFTIGLLCAWQYTRHSIAAMASYFRFDTDKINSVAYRGGGPIGKLRFELDDNRMIEIYRRASLRYQVGFDRYFNTPRCNVCVNHTNFLADMVVGDSWIESTRFSKTGISIMLCRTANATKIAREMEACGRIKLKHVTDLEVVESEGEHLVYGQFAYPYADYLREIGTNAPVLKGPNKGHGTPATWPDISDFHSKLVKMNKLMQSGKYRTILLRKLTHEGHRLTWRYMRWLIQRILNVLKLSRKNRSIQHDDLSGFL